MKSCSNPLTIALVVGCAFRSLKICIQNAFWTNSSISSFTLCYCLAYEIDVMSHVPDMMF